MKTTIALLLAAALLAGCQTATQQRASHMSTVIKQTVAQMKACSTEAYNSPQAAPLRARLPMDPADATLAQLNSIDHASLDEIRSLYAVHDMIQPCRKITADELMTVTPTIVPILLDRYQESDTALLSLINQQTTWGQIPPGSAARGKRRQSQDDRRIDSYPERPGAVVSGRDAASRAGSTGDGKLPADTTSYQRDESTRLHELYEFRQYDQLPDALTWPTAGTSVVWTPLTLKCPPEDSIEWRELVARRPMIRSLEAASDESMQEA